MYPRLTTLLFTAAAAGAAACADGVTPGEPATQQAAPPVLTHVSPPGGAVDVDPDGAVLLTFSHPLMAGMEAYASLHEGDVTGPVVAGEWALAPDRTRLIFRPDAPLASQTQYTIHVGGALRDSEDRPVDCTPGEAFGGRWVTGAMMGDTSGMGPGHDGGMMGDGTMADSTRQRMMGPGWRHPDNGSYGMVFSFTTA